MTVAVQACLPGLEHIAEPSGHRHGTPYETIAPLLSVLRLPGGHWVEPCAGHGDIIEHVANAHLDGLCPLPSFWTAVELRASQSLADMAEQERGDPCLTRSGRIWAFTEFDFLAFNDPDPGVSVVLTNWPWYGFEQLVDHAFALYPRAEVVGLSCVRELLDGDRPEWFRSHHPDVYMCNGRQAFGDAKGAYPHPVAWLHWPANARNRDYGRWQMLPRWQNSKENM